MALRPAVRAAGAGGDAGGPRAGLPVCDVAGRRARKRNPVAAPRPPLRRDLRVITMPRSHVTLVLVALVALVIVTWLVTH
ncbi:MAG: hypothetical protein EKK34_06680 [Mycobacterium sp.]|nr:MAG: hypothetical protein EKK34_06680 [Mycobacterium sp.]